MAAPAMPGGKAIEGLRQQIIANAIILFPGIVCTHMPKAEAFEVAVSTASEGTQYEASLTHTSMPSHAYFHHSLRKTAARGAIKDTVNAALCSLLEVTAFLLETGRIRVLADITPHTKMEVRGGEVDESLLH
ncbi:hypothetical protein LTR36_000796 [Oleoguttula mirabilis]|uniref:Uncharacterized protein n=1 Tax=Oleoguttula mirabilis TaxID=1507867 RepID=A0AAV9J4X1_9PEZI|nr:hypothetical protein LTR36_000796 [Oleoguttula mirabilis]